MDRNEALRRLSNIEGEDLCQLAKDYDIPIFKENGNKNKGWAGHVIERYLGLPLNSSRSPNFGTWELKLISLRCLKKGGYSIKETMQITMLDPTNVEQIPFEDSHLLIKLRRLVVAARIWQSKQEEKSILYGVRSFDLDNPEVYTQVKTDYNLVRETLRTKGFSALTGKMGELIQPRTKGPGHGSTSRAFYAKTIFLKKYIFPEFLNP